VWNKRNLSVGDNDQRILIEQSPLFVVAKSDDRGHWLYRFELHTRVMANFEQTSFCNVIQSDSSATRPEIPSSVSHSIEFCKMQNH